MGVSEKVGGIRHNIILKTLQAGRGIAALLVVLYHNSHSIFLRDKYWGFDPFHRLFEFGDSGVEFFFVLSGFIIFYVHWLDIGRSEKIFRYLRKRILRIYPMYWVVLPVVTVISLYLFPSNLDFKLDFTTLLSCFLLVHFGSGNVVVGVSWTLFHEVLFYALFALLILNKRFGTVVMYLWLIMSCVFISATGPDNPHEYALSPLRFFFSPLHLLFAMGMASAWLVHKSKLAYPFWVVVFGVVAYLGLGMQEAYIKAVPRDVLSLLYGVASVCILTGAAVLELQGKLKVAPFLELLGNASYSIYLVHFPVLSLLAKVFFASGIKDVVPPIIAYIVIAVVAVGAGVVAHLMIEKPLSGFLDKHTKKFEPHIGVRA